MGDSNDFEKDLEKDIVNTKDSVEADVWEDVDSTRFNTSIEDDMMDDIIVTTSSSNEVESSTWEDVDSTNFDNSFAPGVVIPENLEGLARLDYLINISDEDEH